MELFDTSEFIIQPFVNKKCKDCEFRQRWKHGKSVIQYCGITKSNRTENGLLKIKCKNLACIKFKENSLKIIFYGSEDQTKKM